MKDQLSGRKELLSVLALLLFLSLKKVRQFGVKRVLVSVSGSGIRNSWDLGIMTTAWLGAT